MASQLKYTVFKVKWGFFGLLANEKALLRTSLSLQTPQMAKKYLLVGTKDEPVVTHELCPGLQELITAYFRGCCIDFDEAIIGSISLRGSDFRKKILKTCKTVKFGQTISYGRLAELAGFPQGARAAGSVLARNPLPLIIPCHRVIRSDGRIGGFSMPGGEELKKKLLRHEQV